MPVPKGVNPEKYDRCVEDVKDRGGAKNAYAVCAASLKRSEVDWSKTDIQKNIGEFNAFFKATTGRQGSRSSISGYERGVHLGPDHPHVRGQSTMGSHIRNPSAQPGHSQQMSRIHSQVVHREMKQVKPKLPA